MAKTSAKGTKNSSQKAYDKMRVLASIFNEKTNNGKDHIGEDIHFTLRDVAKGISKTRGKVPASRTNFVLDLTRKGGPIDKRLPQSVSKYGYDLRKRTGKVPNSKDSYCGTFVYRGFDNNGNTIPLQDWLVWGTPDEIVPIQNTVPDLVKKYISNDEASLFSVIDYCDILSKVLKQTVMRVQAPMKWQPNEIDGYYVAQCNRNICVYPVEAKAISTKDDINLVQIYGQYNVFISKYTKKGHTLIVRPLAAKMEEDGLLLAVLEINPVYDPEKNRDADMFNITKTYKIVLDPPIDAWKKKKQ